MAKLTIELPDALAEEARDRGLLDPDALQAMIRDRLRETAARELFAAADKLAAAKLPPMTLAEISPASSCFEWLRKTRTGFR